MPSHKVQMVNSTKTFKKELEAILYKCFQKICQRVENTSKVILRPVLP